MYKSINVQFNPITKEVEPGSCPDRIQTLIAEFILGILFKYLSFPGAELEVEQLYSEN